MPSILFRTQQVLFMRRHFLVFFVCTILPDSITRSDAAESVFDKAAKPEILWNEGEFTEGVAVRSDGMVFFSDIPSDVSRPGKILQFDPAAKTTRVFSHDSSKSNGLAFDSGDRLLACCGANGGNRSLCEVTQSGDIKPLVSRISGQLFNSPNDLVVHPNGQVYFSDPRYVGPEPLVLPAMSVYRYDPKSGMVNLATSAAKKPNGVEVSPDGKTLYVAETDNGSAGLPGQSPGKRGRMQLLKLNVADDGGLSNPKVLVDFGNEDGIDGMAVDSAGRIFAAVRSKSRYGIAVYDPSGAELDFVPTAALPTNCCVGAGNDASTLYITAGGGLFRIRLNTRSN
jgi:gluconolactonase